MKSKLALMSKAGIACLLASLIAVVGLMGCSSGSTTAADSDSQSAAESNAHVSEGALGAWDFTEIESDGNTIEQAELDELRAQGAEYFININEDGSFLVCLGDSEHVFEGTWTQDSEGNIALTRENGDAATMVIADDEARIGSSTLVKAGEAKLPPSVNDAASQEGEGEADESDESETDSAEDAAESSEPFDYDSEVSPDLKATLDSYEAFVDEYVEFMQTYENSDDVYSMLADYGDMMQRYADFASQIEALDTDSMSTADYAYYIEVTSRCSQKLLSVA